MGEDRGVEPGRMLGRTSLELGIWADPNERESLARQLMETGS